MSEFDRVQIDIPLQLKILGTDERVPCRLWMCGSPVCDCRAVTLSVARPASASGERGEVSGDPLEIDLDPFARRHILPDGEEEDGPIGKLGRRVEAMLTGEQWDLIQHSFLRVKARAMESLNPDTTVIPFPFLVIEETSEMVAYQEVFPFGEQLQIELDGEEVLVDDQFCVKEACSCSQVALQFFFINRRHPGALNANATAIVDLETGQCTDHGTKRPVVGLAKRLCDAVQSCRRGMLDRLEERRTLVRRIYRVSREALSPLPPGDAPSPRRQTTSNVGRNDPCPCGSGKKYKRCCGR